MVRCMGRKENKSSSLRGFTDFCCESMSCGRGICLVLITRISVCGIRRRDGFDQYIDRLDLFVISTSI